MKFKKIKNESLNNLHLLNESNEDVLEKDSKGNYIVRGNGGYTIFNRHDVSIGGFDDEEVDGDDEKAISRFQRGFFNSAMNEGSMDIDPNPDRDVYSRDELDRIYGPIIKLIDAGEFEKASEEIELLEKDLDEFEAENNKKKFFKWPKFIIQGQRDRINALKKKLPKNESVEDMDRRCDKCNTLLNDGGTCPKCDDGEEDYGDESTTMNEDMSVREKLKAAYPELNIDVPVHEACVNEELSNKEKLLRAFPELNFDGDSSLEEAITTSIMSNREKLKAAYPELNFNDSSEYPDETSLKYEEFDTMPENDFLYDDDYELEDDVEMDRRHAALYGGDRMYCDCGRKLAYNEFGSYCPHCDPQDMYS